MRATLELRLVDLRPCDPRWVEIARTLEAEIAPRRGRGFAERMGQRLMSYSATQSAVAARTRRGWCGLMLYTVLGQYGEVSFPWVHPDGPGALGLQLTDQVHARLTTGGATHIITERTIVAGEADWQLFQQRGFETHWRVLMGRSLRHWSRGMSLPAGYRIVSWDPDWATDIGAVIFEANQGTVDARLYPRFFGGSVRQCTDALRGILEGALGRIDPDATAVLLHGSRARGVCLVGMVGDEPGIIELAVAPAHQGRGLGRGLMIHALTRVVEQGAGRVVLAVSVDNVPALHLYRRLGFVETMQFPVCVWQRR